MNGLIKSLIVFAVISNGQRTKGSILENPETEYFITHIEAVHYCDEQIEKFKQNSGVKLAIIHIKQDMLLHSLLQAEERFSQLKVLSNLSRTCVKKISKSTHSIAGTKRRINQCVNTYKASINMTVPINIRNNLANYYENVFEKEIENCRLNTTTTLKHSNCVTDAIIRATDYTTHYNKTFNEQMEALLNHRNIYVKEALTCSYRIETEIITSIAHANTSISKCMLAQLNFLQNHKVYTCSEKVQMKYSDVSSDNQLLRNPFYKRYNATTCIMVQLV